MDLLFNLLPMLGVMVAKSVVLVGMITWITLLIPLLLTLLPPLLSDFLLPSIKDPLMNLWVSLMSKLKLLMPLNNVLIPVLPLLSVMLKPDLVPLIVNVKV
jgi:hypothetical protein